jgi:hypothetical protein
MTVPTLRGLNELELASYGEGRSKSNWGPREGLLLIAAALMAFGFGWGSYKAMNVFGMELSEHPAFYPPEDMSLTDTWSYFRFLEKSGLDSTDDPRIQQITVQYRKERYYAWVLLGVGLLGLILAIIAVTLFNPARKAANRPVPIRS